MLPVKPSEKLFLITGYARSGTKYMAHLFQHFNYRVGHEFVWADGFCGWQFGYDGDHPRDALVTRGRVSPGRYTPEESQQKKDFSFRYVIHVLRDPWLILQSNLNLVDGTSKLIDRVIPLGCDNGRQTIPRVEREMRGMVEWYKSCRSLKPCLTVKVEHAAFVVPAWLKKNGLWREEKKTDPPSRLTNTQSRGGWVDYLLDVSAVGSVRESVMREFQWFCKDSGYDPKILSGL